MTRRGSPTSPFPPPVFTPAAPPRPGGEGDRTGLVPWVACPSIEDPETPPRPKRTDEGRGGNRERRKGGNPTRSTRQLGTFDRGRHAHRGDTVTLQRPIETIVRRGRWVRNDVLSETREDTVDPNRDRVPQRKGKGSGRDRSRAPFHLGGNPDESTVLVASGFLFPLRHLRHRPGGKRPVHPEGRRVPYWHPSAWGRGRERPTGWGTDTGIGCYGPFPRDRSPIPTFGYGYRP